MRFRKFGKPNQLGMLAAFNISKAHIVIERPQQVDSCKDNNAERATIENLPKFSQFEILYEQNIDKGQTGKPSNRTQQRHK